MGRPRYHVNDVDEKHQPNMSPRRGETYKICGCNRLLYTSHTSGVMRPDGASFTPTCELLCVSPSRRLIRVEDQVFNLHLTSLNSSHKLNQIRIKILQRIANEPPGPPVHPPIDCEPPGTSFEIGGDDGEVHRMGDRGVTEKR